MYIQMTSLVQLTKQSYSSSNLVVRWLNRRQIHGREKFFSVTSGRERPGAKRSSVKRTVIEIKFVFSVFFSFCFRFCWRVLLKIAGLTVTLFSASFGVQVISIAAGKRSIQPIRIPVRSEHNCFMKATYKYAAEVRTFQSVNNIYHIFYKILRPLPSYFYLYFKKSSCTTSRIEMIFSCTFFVL